MSELGAHSWLGTAGEAEAMPIQDVTARVCGVFSRRMNLEVPSGETDLFESGLLDSLTFVDLLVHLEEEFSLKLKLDEIDLDSFRSISRIAEMLRSGMARRPRTQTAAAVMEAAPWLD
jgi:methoxymalonate biosynthesis acyl carrier protein